MPDIIEVKNVSKSFIISHEGHKSYTALRDVVASQAKKIFSFPKSLFTFYNANSKEEFWAIKDVSFKVEQGDRIGIIGKNGAGKSTLLKILSRITEPTKGEIRIRGTIASLLEVGTGFHPELTGRENIFLNGAILGMARAEIRNKFDEIVAFAEVEKFLDTSIKHYSTGMYVRLAFAVAAHLDPQILIIDEVLAVGDAQFQKKCLGKMEEVSKKEGKTILFVSHNVVAVRSLCSKGISLIKGEIKNIGETDYVINDYLDTIDIQDKFREWEINEAPGTDKMKIISASVYNNNRVLYIHEDVYIRFVFEILESMELYLILILRTLFGEVILQAPTEIKSFNKKRWTAKFVLPKNFLNTGHFSVQINFVKADNVIHYYHQDIISFSLEQLETENNYAGTLAGYIKPKLVCEIN